MRDALLRIAQHTLAAPLAELFCTNQWRKVDDLFVTMIKIEIFVNINHFELYESGLR